MELRQPAKGRGMLSLTGGADAGTGRETERRERIGLKSGEDVQAGRYAHMAESAAERAAQSAAAAEEAMIHTPVPGDNENWLIWDQQTGGYTDSGKRSRGEPGLSAWELAVRGGFEGSEEAFAQALAQIGRNGQKLAVADDEGNIWYFLDGEGSEGDLVIQDGEGGFWHLCMEQGGEGTLPPGGVEGDLLVRTENGCAWVAPADSAEADNTRPITAAGVHALVGNIDALLAII